MQITLISCDFVMFYDIFSQNGQRPRLIRNSPAKYQSALASAHRLILRFIASSRAFFFAISSRVGLPPLFALRFLHSRFPTLNPIAKETRGLQLGSYFARSKLALSSCRLRTAPANKDTVPVDIMGR
jgi:hypothetical protein